MIIKYPLNVTIDTNIFEENKFDFSSTSTMSLLVKYVKSNKIKLILSDIVINEVKKHICRCVDNVCGKARKLRKEYLGILPQQYLTDIGLGVYVQIPNKEETHKKAIDVFETFLSDCRVERLDTKNIDLEKVLKDYFEVCPPFENSEKKKKEFPDAFIAEEIKYRFGDSEVVAIISKDDGFKKACTNSRNHLFFSSLGELFDKLSQSEKEYKSILEKINIMSNAIIKLFNDSIHDEQIVVNGKSHDSDGIVSGFDYDEIYIDRHCMSSVKIQTIDDIDGDIVNASIYINGNIDINCYFDDYANSPWDEEEQNYIFIKRRHIVEHHNARINCRIEFNNQTEQIRILPFKIILDSDSLKNRYEVDDEMEAFYKEIEDSDREDLGFLPLSDYSKVLADELNDSNMATEILKLFEKYNSISLNYEELTIQYDEMLTKIKDVIHNNESEQIFKRILSIDNLPFKCSETNEQILSQKIISWLNEKYSILSNRSERNLPDYLEYGENIVFSGIEDTTYTLSLGKLSEINEVGCEEQVDLSIMKNNQIIANGCVKVTVGYLNIDEDGGVADGIEDSILYEVEDIINAIKDIFLDLDFELSKEQKITTSLYKAIIKQK